MEKEKQQNEGRSTNINDKMFEKKRKFVYLCTYCSCMHYFSTKAEE